MRDCPQEILNRIWRLFAAQGIADDLQIIEAVAHDLLVKAGHTTQAGEPDFPRPVTLAAARAESLQSLLDDALASHEPGALLNHCLLFRLSTMQAGGRYPTPRHIADLMADLVQEIGWRLTEREPRQVADFACGSGGLLAPFASDTLAGVEISPSWARLARANLLLNGCAGATIHTGDAFAVVGEQIEHSFDVILMNPPFGVQLEGSLVDRRLGPESGARSETAMALLGLQRLADDGRLAILQPGGTLFSTGKGEKKLREKLLEEGQLDAIVQLPKDAFQPYSQLQTYLLLARQSYRSSRESEAPVWFYHISHDGFSSGRNRQPQPEQSQLPLLANAVRAALDFPEWVIKDDSGETQLVAHTLAAEGTLITQPGDGKLTVQAITLPNATSLWLTRQTES
ncbi:MAG: hypothetical protein D6816_11775, partial [Bacteroidetes bacterium]